jgi:hypothetical protein
MALSSAIAELTYFSGSPTTTVGRGGYYGGTSFLVSIPAPPQLFYSCPYPSYYGFILGNR